MIQRLLYLLIALVLQALFCNVPEAHTETYFPTPPGGVTGNNATLILIEDHDTFIRPGDELCAHGDANICYGVLVWGEGHQHLVVWGNNLVTTPVDGFLEGEEIRYRHWSLDEGREQSVSAVYATTWQQHTYTRDGIYHVVRFEPALGINMPEPPHLPALFALDEPYPNPANGAVYLDVHVAVPDGVQLAVIDLLGRALINKAVHADAGVHRLRVDLSRLPPGVYGLVVQHRGNTERRLITVV